MLRHVARTALAKAETMSLADALQNDLVPLFAAREVVAWNGVPAEPPADGEPSVFAAENQQRGIFSGNFAGPSKRVFVARVAEHRKKRIAAFRQTNLPRGTCVAAATAREHGDDGLPLIGKDEAFCRRSRKGRRTVGSGRLPKELAVCEITKIEIRVSSAARDKIRTVDNRLCLQRL